MYRFSKVDLHAIIKWHEEEETRLLQESGYTKAQQCAFHREEAEKYARFLNRSIAERIKAALKAVF